MHESAPNGVADGLPRDGAGASSRVVVSVGVPEGVIPPKRVTVSFEPETADEFEALVQALGGPGEFTAMPSFAFAKADGATVHVHRPTATDLPPQRDPFMDAFEERIKLAKTPPCPVPDSEDEVPW